MKIGFQGWFLTQPYTGIGQHCIGILRELAKTKGTEVIIATPQKTKIKGIPKRWIKVIKPKFWIPHPGLRRWYWERVQVPIYFAKLNPDWEYYPYPCPLPRNSSNLRAMTVHDLILWKDPRYQGNKLKSKYYQKARIALVDVDQVFTVSQTTHDQLDLPNAKVLYNGAPEIPKKLPKSPYPNALVYIGGYDQRKNVPQLIKAFEWVKKTHPEMALVLIGKPHHKSKHYPSFPDSPGVLKVGTLSDKQVYALLKESFAFVHFSDSEGFNIPLLQAMAAGTPAIVADIPVNHEVSADTVKFIRLSRKSDLLSNIQDLFDKRRRTAIIKKQKARAKEFSWKKTTKQFLKTLKK